MPKEYAQRLAQRIIEDHVEDPIVVDVPNDGFNVAVADALEELGFRVERDKFKPRLTIYKPAAGHG